MVAVLVGAGIMLVSTVVRFTTRSADDTPPESPDNMLLSELVPEQQATMTPRSTPIPPPVIVYISGAVRQPDVYELPHNARVKDVVVAAGGFTPDADRISVNLAAHLEDAQHIHILRQGEQPPAPPGTQSATNDQTTNLPDDQQVNINTASATQLQELDGIGTVLAERIVEYRTVNGPFTSIEALSDISGISPAMVQALQDHVTVGP